jgi:putative ubiquitin-RnfH superfamily antitoxin RatB of RatAB toxin-antitoxin module
MKFSVAHAAGSASFWQELESTEELSAEQAIRQSKLLNEFPDLDLTSLKIGVFGKICQMNQLIQEGDRVEVYLPSLVQASDDDDDDDDD